MSNFTDDKDLKSEYDLGWKEYKIISLFKEEKKASPHKVKRQLQCDLCGYYHVSKHDMKLHLDIHLHQTEKMIGTMDICLTSLLGSDNQNIVIKPKLSQIGRLRDHINIHIGEEPNQCDACSARFTRSSDLKKHALIHSGEKHAFSSLKNE